MKDDDCKSALEELYIYLDGELTPDRRAHVAQHLHDCGSCFETYDFHAEIRQVVAQKCRDDVPEGLMDRIAGAIRQDQAPDA